MAESLVLAMWLPRPLFLDGEAGVGNTAPAVATHVRTRDQ
jgi:hypothetical protein